MKRIIIIIFILSLSILTGCFEDRVYKSKLEIKCEPYESNIDSCDYSKCIYENSDDYKLQFRNELLNTYYECKNIKEKDD